MHLLVWTSKVMIGQSGNDLVLLVLIKIILEASADNIGRFSDSIGFRHCVISSNVLVLLLVGVVVLQLAMIRKNYVMNY